MSDERQKIKKIGRGVPWLQSAHLYHAQSQLPDKNQGIEHNAHR